MKQFLRTLALILFVGTASANAQNSAAVARDESSLSGQILHNYVHHRDTRAELTQLIELHRQLKAAHPRAEKANLVQYLELCIAKLRQTLQTPPTPQSIARVEELTRQIKEGSLYVASR
ncbi:hypothetical protein [Nitratifractor salsuginis]|uniref:Uncharacterized protein n=1 Tax=Nitratifractor salsuginis (strain DSM 16511 / JCM 12458 / E9I37-1) TaxID=749222 RepID=E6X153_NITSE|nr:hypothetical protein [Nitratifractor salsuginis]ADV45856.1 hypothetical protein Nitsa_0588 [Nitratifractor salsuginis DSM 16511]